MKKILIGMLLGAFTSAAIAQITINSRTVRNAMYENYIELVAGDSVTISGNKITSQTLIVPVGKTARVSIRISAEIE